MELLFIPIIILTVYSIIETILCRGFSKECDRLEKIRDDIYQELYEKEEALAQAGYSIEEHNVPKYTLVKIQKK